MKQRPEGVNGAGQFASIYFRPGSPNLRGNQPAAPYPGSSIPHNHQMKMVIGKIWDFGEISHLYIFVFRDSTEMNNVVNTVRRRPQGGRASFWQLT